MNYKIILAICIVCLGVLKIFFGIQERQNITKNKESSENIIQISGYSFPKDWNLKTTGEKLENQAKLGGVYLMGANNNGKFNYQYDPQNDRNIGGYNMLRHEGSIYSMCQLTNMFPNEHIEKSSINGISWMTRNMRIVGSGLVVLDESGNIKLGGNGLGMLALLECYKKFKDTNYVSIAQTLAIWILDNQDINGNFVAHKLSYPSMKISDFHSSYYPGEALYGLISLYEIQKNNENIGSFYLDNEELLESINKGIHSIGNYITKNRSLYNIQHDHWLLYVLEKAQKYDDDPYFVSLTKKIVDSMALSQHTLNSELYGSWYNNGSYTPVSTRCEGLSKAYKIFERINDNEYKNKTKDTLNKSLIFLSKGQIDLLNYKNFPKPNKSLGGVVNSLTDPKIRIDYVQHAMSCWLNSIDVFK